nr:hypothetical protein [Actinomycetes bacterium]
MTTSVMAAARRTTGRSIGTPRPRAPASFRAAPAASSAAGMLGHDVGSEPSLSPNRAETSTYDSESPPSPTNESARLASGRPRTTA